MSVRVRHIQARTLHGAADAMLFLPQESGIDNGSCRAIIVWSDLTGLRPAVADLGQRLAQQGYVVLVPNAFYRSVRLDGTAVGAAQRLDFGGTMQRGAPWRAAASDSAIADDTGSYIALLDSLPQVQQAAPIGVLGVDIGGAHAFVAARARPDRIKAVAVVHPLSIATPRETSPHLFVDRSNAAYLVDIAASDDAREPMDKDDLRAAFAAAGLPGQVRVIGAGHGYFVADDPAFEAPFANQSWDGIVAHFAASLP